MSESWSAEASSTPVTAKSLRAAFDKIANAPAIICGVTHPHVVSPSAAPGSWTLCANCFQAVHLPTNRREENP